MAVKSTLHNRTSGSFWLKIHPFRLRQCCAMQKSRPEVLYATQRQRLAFFRNRWELNLKMASAHILQAAHPEGKGKAR